MKKSNAKVVHETAKGLHKAGVMRAQTMREFDALSLPTVKKYTPRQIRLLRQRNQVSQAVFAQCLNTSVSTVQKWEQGEKHPSSIARKLLSIVDENGIKCCQ